MRNLLLGFMLGIVVATGASAWAQLSGTTFTYGDDPDAMVTFSGGSVSGTIFSYAGGGVKSYTDSTGRNGILFTYPGTGVTSYTFHGGKQPC